MENESILLDWTFSADVEWQILKRLSVEHMIDPDVNYVEYTVSTITSSLLKRVQSEETDEEAWDRVVFLYSPLVYKWCRKAGLSSHDAGDVGQQVFRKVADRVSDFRREKKTDTFSGWLRTITRNAVIDRARREEKQPASLGDSNVKAQFNELALNEFGDGDDSVAEDNRDVFRRILDHGRSSINPTHWAIFWQVVVEDRTPVDVATEFEVKRSYVDVVKSRVLASLRQQFAEN